MSGYIGTQPVPQATQTRETFTATASQTSFATGGYQAGYLDVFLNGVKLVDGTDYTATNGSDVVLTTGAASGDTLEVVAYTAFTVADQTFTGDIVMSDGLTVDNDGATVLTVDRATSDGVIIDVQKNGISVGSIGTTSGGFYVNGTSSVNLNNGTNEVGFGTGAIAGNGSGNDATIDLGRNNRRFKDLYLSGGVYLGGTGSANKLDDYEEGTWSPGITGWTGTYGRQDGVYTKIGRWVHCYGGVRTNGGTGSFTSDFPGIAGLPFTSGISVSAAMGFAHIVSGSTGIPSTKTSLLPLDGPGSGNTSAFPNWVGVAGDSGNFNKVYLNASSNVEYRLMISYRTT